MRHSALMSWYIETGTKEAEIGFTGFSNELYFVVFHFDIISLNYIQST